MMNDRLAQLLHQKFGCWPLPDIPDDCGVITAADSKYFFPFQLLYYSLKLSTGCPIILFDMGLNEDQLAWCATQADLLQVVPLADIEKELIFRPTDHYMWHTWNKTIYFRKSPFTKTIWLDADCIALHSIVDLFTQLDEVPLFFKDTHRWPKHSAIAHELFETNMIPHQSSPPCLNAGVIGLHRGRKIDDKIVDKWENAIQQVAQKGIADEVPWHDQGCLQWVLETENCLNLIQDATAWDNVAYTDFDDSNLYVFLESLDLYTCNIAHMVKYIKKRKDKLFWELWDIDEIPLNCHESDFEPFREIDERVAENLTIFVLVNEWEDVNRIPSKPYLRPIKIDTLDLPREWQTDQLGDVRILLSDVVENIETEYVGIINFTANFQSSQQPVVNMLGEPIRQQLSPNSVLALHAPDLHKPWFRRMESTTSGLGRFFRTVCKQVDIDCNEERTSPSLNFICHTTVFKEFLDYFRGTFEQVFSEYCYDMPYKIRDNESQRHATPFYEGLASLYFANRGDLKIVPLANRILMPCEINTDTKAFAIQTFEGRVEAVFAEKDEARQFANMKNYTLHDTTT